VIAIVPEVGSATIAVIAIVPEAGSATIAIAVPSAGDALAGLSSMRRRAVASSASLRAQANRATS